MTHPEEQHVSSFLEPLNGDVPSSLPWRLRETRAYHSWTLCYVGKDGRSDISVYRKPTHTVLIDTCNTLHITPNMC